MSLAGWLAALAVGLLAGGLSGLIGIGGGAIMVPFLYFYLGHPELSGAGAGGAGAAVVAHATSLLAIVPISLRGAWLYHRSDLVDWPVARRVAPASALLAFLGAHTAISLPGELLRSIFGVFLLVAAARLVVPRSSFAPADTSAGWGRTAAAGAAVGFTSALLGVGGGLVAIPVLIYWLHTPLRRVSATSLAIIAVTATVGVLSYAISGWARAGSALAYIDVSGALALTLGALLAVPLGTRLQQRLPTAALRWLFAVLFVVLGGRIAFQGIRALVAGS